MALLPGVPFLYPTPLLGGVTPDPYIQITINILQNFNKHNKH